MMRSLNSEDIRVVLPHRGRMLLLTGAEIDEESSLGVARLEIGPGSWCATLTCPHLYVIEALAQLAGVTLAWLAVDPEYQHLQLGKRLLQRVYRPSGDQLQVMNDGAWGDGCSRHGLERSTQPELPDTAS